MLQDLHERVLQGDADAIEDICGRLLHRLVSNLKRAWPAVDPGIIENAAEDAVLGYLSAAHAYEPSKSPLDRYLALAAHHNVIDAVRRDLRRSRHEVAVADLPEVAPRAPAGQSRWRYIRAVLASAQTRAERALLAARFRGERRTRHLAEAMGLAHESTVNQRAVVKRTWDRLRARIRTALKKTGKL